MARKGHLSPALSPRGGEGEESVCGWFMGSKREFFGEFSPQPNGFPSPPRVRGPELLCASRNVVPQERGRRRQSQIGSERFRAVEKRESGLCFLLGYG